ncbi:Oleoyl-acyl carrier protein thioesterase, chloroplastic [Capsicum annuum]|nr:Oleoyl-acyl carrier protein thioesterase, chloroplastic [Capsicum annuum]
MILYSVFRVPCSMFITNLCAFLCFIIPAFLLYSVLYSLWVPYLCYVICCCAVLCVCVISRDLSRGSFGNSLSTSSEVEEVGCNHAQSVGFSTDGFATTHSMRKLHLIWVTARMYIEIYKYPAWSDVVEIETWCQSEGRIGTRRDWILKDCATGEVIGRATSKWLMMNQDTRRLQKVTDEVRDELELYFPKELRLAFPEENNGSLKKIPKLEDPAEYSKLGLVPRRADLDMNQHVNNVTYIGWVLESLPQEIIDTHELGTITIDYRRECQHDDVVDSLTSVEPIEDTDALGANGSATAAKDVNKSFLHLLRLSSDGLEINRCRTEWRKKPSRI